jgi:hypothetical protein
VDEELPRAVVQARRGVTRRRSAMSRRGRNHGAAVFSILMGAIVTLGGAVSATAQVIPDKGEFYLSPLAAIQIINFPSSIVNVTGASVGSSFGATFGSGFGIGVAENVAIEPEFTVGFGSDPKATAGNQSGNIAFSNAITLTGNLVYFIPGSSRMTPYVVGGLGLARFAGGGGSNSDFYLQFGGGVDAFDLGDSGSVRLDGRLGFAIGDGTEMVLRFGASFVIPIAS